MGICCGWRTDETAALCHAVAVIGVMQVVAGKSIAVTPCTECPVPIFALGAALAINLHDIIATQFFHSPFGSGKRMQGMIELDYIALLAKHVELHLHLRGQQRQQMVETVHTAAAKDKLVELEEVISMLVDINLQSRVKRVRCQLVVVGECHNVIAQFLIYPVYVVRPIFTLVQNTIDTCMGVEIGLFPAMRGIDATIWVVYVGPRELTGGSEIVYNTYACGNNCHKHDKQQCI